MSDYLFRISDGMNFMASMEDEIWGIKSTSNAGKSFIKNAEFGDRLWFIQNRSHGKIIAVATYCSYNMRELGPHLDITKTDEELGWVKNKFYQTCDTEIHYSNLYNLEECNLLTHIKGNSSIRKYTEKCKIDLATEYKYIERYARK